MKTRRSMLAAAAVAATLVASARQAAAADRPLIGVVLYARDSQFWQQVERGMKDAAAKNGADLQIVLNRRQLPTEAQVMDDLMTRGIKALVISPLDKDASANAVRAARAQHLPIVEYNTFFADRAIATNSVGVDNKELAASVGREMDKSIKAHMDGQAKIGLIPLPSINPGSAVRKQGMLSALTDVKVDIVSEIEGATPEQGANAVESILRRDPQTQIIWASNSGTLAGAATTVARMQGKVELYGIDMSEELAHAMLQPDSRIIAVSDQQPYQIGYLAVEAAVKDLSGQPAPRDIQVPAKIYTKSDAAGLNDYIKLVQSLGQ
jgi:ABC-type sugar transport system substrate-binding protein